MAAWAADAPPPLPRGLFGNVGMIDTPTARMAPDGELYAGAGFFRNNQHYMLGFQIFPWLETDFRYSGLQHFDPAFPVYYDRSFALKARLWDESGIWPAFAVGINDIVGTGVYGGEYAVLSKQFGSLDTSLGIGFGRLGTANSFRNPLSLFHRSLNTRPTINAAGKFDIHQFFRGPAGVFGGINWRTPIKGLTLIAELSSDAYTLEAARANFRPRTQFNFGASYQFSDSIALGVNYLYGDSVGGTITFLLDPVQPQYSAVIAPPMPEVTPRPPEQQQAAIDTMLRTRRPPPGTRIASRQGSGLADLLFQAGASDVRMAGSEILLTVRGAVSMARCRQIAQLAQAQDPSISGVGFVAEGSGAMTMRCTAPATPRITRAVLDRPVRGAPLPLMVIDGATAAPATAAELATAERKIRAALRAQRLDTDAIRLGSSEVTIYYSNGVYFKEAEAIERITRVLMANAPPSIEKFRLVSISQAIPDREFDILRSPAERNLALGAGTILADAVTATPATLNNPILAAADRRNFPRFSWNAYPQFRQALFDPDNPFGVQFLMAVEAQVELWRGLTIGGEGETNLYDTFDVARLSNSVLPHVRSDFNQYFTYGKHGMGNLEADYRFRITPDIFAIAKAGYLESMFAGVGGEVLWRPQGQRWALGVDAYEVRQRNFDRLLGLQKYQAFTGLVSLYYQSPWYNIDMALRAGQYLAGDRGLTFEVTRRFSTGVEIGAFATKTNVSSTQFGEGSFDKGIIIRIPLGWALPIESRSQFAMDLRPVQRDGGQRLLGDALLYGETRASSEGEMARAAAP